MKYDFDKIVDRKNISAIKWDVKQGELPMWIADMDFETLPQVKEALSRRVENGTFGYTDLDEEWYDSIIAWWKRRHHFDIEKEWLIFSTGVIPTLSSCVRKLTTPGENVLIMTPVYNIFYNCILNNGCKVSEYKLKYEDGKYSIDWDELESAMSDKQTGLMFLCNPHNPIGKIWDRETLYRIGELADKYDITIISDEIHCDLTYPGKEYIPFASVSEKCKNRSITCIAPMKTFNLAGLQTSAVFVPNKTLRYKVWRSLNTDEVGEPNVFASIAASTAFRYGDEWLDQLREYLFENKKCVREFISKELPELKLIESEATYLLWIDCSYYKDIEDPAGYIRKKTGLILNEGGDYGGNGRGFVRMNIACPTEIVKDGLKRLKKAFG